MPTEHFAYLGVLFTATLNWNPQTKEILRKLRQKLANLKRSKATPAQIAHIINTCIKPFITYSFPVVPYTDNDIHAMDKLLTAAIKFAYGLHVSNPTALAHEDIDKFGLGCTSLLVDLVQAQVQALTETMQDEHRLGVMARRALEQQLQSIKTTAPEQLPRNLTHHMGLSQLVKMRTITKELKSNGQYILPPIESELITKITNLGHAFSPDNYIRNELLLPLQELNIRSPTQLMEANQTHMMDQDAMKRTYPRTLPIHLTALNHITLYLHQDPENKEKITPQAGKLTKILREVHPEYRKRLFPSTLKTPDMAPGTNSIIPFLVQRCTPNHKNDQNDEKYFFYIQDTRIF